MKQTALKLAGVAFAMAFAAVTAHADVAIHQNVSVYGYAAGSVSYEKFGDFYDNSATGMDIDAAKLGFAFDFAPVTAKLSFYTDRGAGEIYVLEANGTYDFGNGLSITGGRYQSSIGYEAFDIPNTSFITYGTTLDALDISNGYIYYGVIPDFSEGVKINYAFGKFNASVSVVNSILYKGGPYRGDGNLSDGYGVEAHLGYAGGALSAGATIAYENSKTADRTGYVADAWVQYVLKEKTTFAAELYYGRYDNKHGSHYHNYFYGLAMVRQKFTDKFSLAARFSAGRDTCHNGLYESSTFWKLSIAPTHALTANLDVRAEVSYTKFGNDIKYADNNVFAGVQAVFKF